jgi:hypothetical protein
LRRLLHRELNVEPDPETHALFQQIRTEAREKAALGARLTPPGGKAPRSRFPRLRALGSLTPNLPVSLTSFIGREREIAEVKSLLSTSHVLTLTGAGGCGRG